MNEVELFREVSVAERSALKYLNEDDFDICLGFNTSVWWVDCQVLNLLFGWFDTEEEANEFITKKKYLKKGIQCAIDYDMDI